MALEEKEQNQERPLVLPAWEQLRDLALESLNSNILSHVILDNETV